MQLERNISRDIQAITEASLALPQAECSVSHYFGHHIYIREVTIPAGVLAVGHYQKEKHNNIMLSGKIAMITDDGVKILTAPLIFEGEPGRKIGLALETVVWQNIWATDETDIEVLEDMYLDKSAGKAHEDEMNALDSFGRQLDRDDYELVVEASYLTRDEIKAVVENELDQCAMPKSWMTVTQRRKSNIHGYGMFCSYPVDKDICLGPALLDGKRTPLGRYTNHSKSPNAYPVRESSGDIYFWAARNINGCHGGDNGEEVTVNYRDTQSLAEARLCRQ